MKLDKRSTSVIGFAVIIGLLMAGWFLVVSPSISKQSELSAELSDTEDKIEAHKAKLVELEQIKAEIGKYQQQDQELTAKFPGEADIKLLLNDITEAGQRAGVKTISNVETGTPELQQDPTQTEQPPSPEQATGSGGGEPTGGNLATMSLNLTAEGSEGSLMKYATELTNMDRSFLVQESSIDCSETCKLTISGTTYLYRPTVLPQEGQAQEPNNETVPTPEG